MRWRWLAAVLLVTLSSCRKTPAPLEFVPQRSAFGDFECLVPKGWETESARQGDTYRFSIWLGPEHDGVLWGRPRIVAAWHAAGKTFDKPSGDKGKFDSADDYVKQNLRTVWGPDAQFVEPRRPVTVGGRAAERLAVRVEKDAYMALPGARPVSAGGERMWRRDTAVLVPTRSGFYTFVYPAAEKTQPLYAAAFDKFIESLVFLKDSPVE
ncbi:MAG: hypothetical protein HY553_17560 [Elusimicrobia bacterium]|nr:hypothetical protein [Elusimicrobiota bacterium]